MRSGVRCAETIFTSCAIPSASSVSAACRTVSQSDWLPMIMPTAGAVAMVELRLRERPRGKGRDYRYVGATYKDRGGGGVSRAGEDRGASRKDLLTIIVLAYGPASADCEEEDRKSTRLNSSH